MSSYVPGGGYSAPQLVTVSNPQPSQLVVPIVQTIAGVTTTLESLFLEIDMLGHFTTDVPPVLKVQWVDPTGLTIFEHASYTVNED